MGLFIKALRYVHTYIIFIKCVLSFCGNVDASSTCQSPLRLLRRCRRPASFILRQPLTRGGSRRQTTAGTNHSAAARRGDRRRSSLIITAYTLKIYLSHYTPTVRENVLTTTHTSHGKIPPNARYFLNVYIFFKLPPLHQLAHFPRQAANRAISAHTQETDSEVRRENASASKSKLQILWFSSKIISALHWKTTRRCDLQPGEV